jgi:hypothetical protein
VRHDVPPPCYHLRVLLWLLPCSLIARCAGVGTIQGTYLGFSCFCIGAASLQREEELLSKCHS